MVASQKLNKMKSDSPSTASSASDESAEFSAEQTIDDFLDKGPDNSKGTKNSKGSKSPQRRCIVTREILPTPKLVRFVLGPDNVVVPDVNCKLPGRGAWVTAKHELVLEAAEKNHFSRVFKKKVKAPSDLSLMTAKILEQFALGSLAMARASGAMEIGFSKIDTMIRSSDAWLVLEASDGSKDGKRKIAQACRAVDHLGGEQPDIYEIFTSREMADVIAGGENGSSMVHLGLRRSQNARSTVNKIRRLAGYLGVEPVDVSAQNSSNTRQE